MPPPLSEEELNALTGAHRRWGADEASLTAIARLGNPGARVVVAGQQPGLLCGPLYTLYKALGAVKLAEQLKDRHPALDFVPVFWVASEDHDYEEVAGAVWPLAGGELTEFRFHHPDASPGREVGTLAAAPVIEPLVEAILAGTHETEFRAAILDRLRRSAEADTHGPATWEDVFCRLLLWLLRDTGLVLVSPLMPWVRRRGAVIVRREIESAGESTRLILQRSAKVEEAGLPTPLHRGGDAVNFFHVDAALRRRPVKLGGGGLVCPGSAAGSSGGTAETLEGPAEAWLDRLAREPGGFSTNVVTRPLVQDSILPTVAQLVGPGEAAYFTQVEAVYERFGVFAPVRYPRPQALLVERSVERTLQKLKLEALDVTHREVEALMHTIQVNAGDEGVGEALAALKERQEREALDLKSRLAKGGAAAAAVDKLVQALERGYEAVAERHREDRRRQEPQLESSLRKLRANLAPRDMPQERVFNPVVPFAVKYGPEWVAMLRRHLRVEWDRGLQVLTPGS